jgi:DNA-binding NarL/FixJ family response regulator
MPRFFLIDDDPLVLRALRHELRGFGECQTASSAKEAEARIIAGDSWDGLVIDVRLGDGSGVDILSLARDKASRTPAVLLSGVLEPEIVNQAAILDARFICKPWDPGALAPFLDEVLRRAAPDRIGRTVALAQRRFDLTAREVEILVATLHGGSREAYLQASGMTANTLKAHVKNLLEKTNSESLLDLAIALLVADE